MGLQEIQVKETQKKGKQMRKDERTALDKIK